MLCELCGQPAPRLARADCDLCEANLSGSAVEINNPFHVFLANRGSTRTVRPTLSPLF